MFIKEVVIDGFKSYAQRTTIAGWDPTFNAITGLNGSGKSNVLDAICFVLGITNLSQVRASNLTDLVYKSGQSGITKASVSIVFDNSDAKSSPIGYEHCETITVTRTIVIGGRNKYLINGHAVQATAVQNLFHSVQLNVNNPHFLIMQGRITKVLNMKPPEILGMIEEAAGTRMFEGKKQAALKTIEKKQTKFDEITKILAEDINPRMEKLIAERAAYLTWAKNNTECERLARFCVAYEFVAAQAARDRAVAAQAEAVAAVKATADAIKAARATITKREAEVKAKEAESAAAQSGAYRRLVEAEEKAGREAATASAALDNADKALKDEQKARAALAKATAEGDGLIAALAAKLEKQKADAAAAAALATAAAEEVARLMNAYTAASAGMMVATGGAGAASSSSSASSGEATGTLSDQLLIAKNRVSTLTGEIKQGEMNIKHLHGVARDLDKQAKAAASDAAGLQAALASATKALAAKRERLAALKFNPAEEDAIRTQRDALHAEISDTGDRIESEAQSLSRLVDCVYDASVVPKDAVKGPVARQFTLKNHDAATALEVAAAGKLFQVVVDSEVTGNKLIKEGKLQRRVTFIPLNKIKRNAIDADKVALAASVSKGKAVPAIDLIAFPETMRPAMEFVFGGFFVCQDAETAKAIAYHPRIRTAAVTYEGDLFDPAGTLEGGSKPDRDGKPLLVRIAETSAGVTRLAAARKELDALEARLAAMAKAAAEYVKLSSETEIATTELSLTQQRMDTSQLGATEAKLKATAAELEALQAALEGNKAALKEAQARVKDLESQVANMAKAREQRMAEVQKQLDAARKAAATEEGKAKKLAQAADATACELKASEKEASSSTSQLKAADDAVAKAQAALEAATAKHARLDNEWAAAKRDLDDARRGLADMNKAIKALMTEIDAARKTVEDGEQRAKELDAKQKTLVKEAQAGDKTASDLLKKHAWIEADRAMFGKPHTDYDFEKTDPAAASKRLSELEKKQGELERSINKKVIGMIESLERDCADLLNKKRIIENDKAKIEHVISELDEKKNEALRTTWAKVNKDFGSIFGTLLPGVTSKLDPPEGGTVLDGLEVKVAFNGVWKETLTELSGGQRSLLALSLILALLLFKPAPMYILDEVDAALDLSHTQNIGHMIRTHFGHSQFIVVSLKQGMFNNANVIFRTKFVEGIGSTVARTVPSSSALLTDAPASAASGGAAVKSRKAAGAASAVDDDDVENVIAAAGAAKGAVAARRGKVVASSGAGTA